MTAPHNRCGFELTKGLIINQGVADSDTRQGLIEMAPGDWHCQYRVSCCWRHVWKDTGRCIWHAAIDEKSSEVLVSAYSEERKGSVLDGAVLRGLELKDSLSFLDCRLRGADLREVNLSGADLRYTDLSGSNLWGADLSGSNLSGTDFSGASLLHADLSGAYLLFADLSETDLTEADFSGAELRGVDFSGADIWTDLPGAALSGADFSDADLSGADLTDADFSGTIAWVADLWDADPADLMDMAQKAQTKHFRAANLRGADLQGADLSEANLRGTDLTETNLRETTLVNLRLDQESRIRTLDETAINSASEFDSLARTYHALGKAAKENGLVGKARGLRIRERLARQREARANGDWSAFAGSLVSEWAVGYGVSIRRISVVILLIIVGCAGLYSAFGVSNGETPLALLLNALDYSVATFTGVGPRNPPRDPLMRAVVFLEAFVGILFSVLLGYVLGTREAP